MSYARSRRVETLSANRRMAAASASVCRERNTIHIITEVDVSAPRRLIREYDTRTGERLSLTAYVVACLARAVAEHPRLNSLRKGGKLYLLKDVTVGVLVERDLAGEQVPEPFGLRSADTKTYRQIHEEIRAAQRQHDERLGGLSGATWVRYLPSALFRAFVRTASRSVTMAERYGVISVTAVGMFGGRGAPLWLVPLSASTVAVAVGSIVERPAIVGGGVEPREHLCLTLSFDHDIIDGAPAARFTRRFGELVASGDLLGDIVTSHEAAPTDDPAPVASPDEDHRV